MKTKKPLINWSAIPYVTVLILHVIKIEVIRLALNYSTSRLLKFSFA